LKELIYTEDILEVFMKRMKLVIIALFVISVVGFSAGAEEIRALVGQVSQAGIDAFTNLYNAIAEATGNTVKIEVVPTARGVYLVTNGQADAYCPVTALTDPKKIADLDFDYSTVVTHETPMVLYENKKSNISVDELKQGNKAQLKIETSTTMVDNFTFPMLSSTNPEASLKKLDSGLTDGYIYSQAAADVVLQKLGLTSIKRVFYMTAQGVFAIKKGGKGGNIDKILSKGIDILKANGKYAVIMSSLVGPGSQYKEWQP
jgi:hypothetical protein